LRAEINWGKKRDNLKNAENGSETEKVENNWEIRYYVDEFNQPTSKGYVANKELFSGTFSNTATADSELSAQIIADKYNVAIKLWEYGRSEVKTSSSEKYDITILKPDGDKSYIDGKMYGDRLYIGGYSDELLSSYENDPYRLYPITVLKILQGGGDVSFYIVQSDRPTTTYLFTVDADGFSREYSKCPY